MSVLDAIRAKFEELMGGAGEQVSGVVDEVTQQASEIPGADQLQDLKDSVLPGDQAEKK